jgi:hypothetical protein
MDRTQEAAQIITRVLEALARASGKTLSQKTRADLARACELLSTPSDLDILEDLLEMPPIRSDRTTVNFEREASPPDYGDRKFGEWRAGR